jgi:regulator of replication initiation timing
MSTVSTKSRAEALRDAANEAKQIIGGLNDLEKQALIEATLFQAIASGDIIAAAVTQKVRLQRENLRLRARLARVKLKIEEQKLKALETLNKPKPTPTELQNAIAAIYGLPPRRQDG